MEIKHEITSKYLSVSASELWSCSHTFLTLKIYATKTYTHRLIDKDFRRNRKNSFGKIDKLIRHQESQMVFKDKFPKKKVKFL
jgi:hypothetical protein